MRFLHLPGVKNEMCDWLSRTDFDALLGEEIEQLAQDAFARMDRQIDLSLQQLLSLDDSVTLSAVDFQQSEFSDLWSDLEPFQAKMLNIPYDGPRRHAKDEQIGLFYRTEKHIFCERRLMVPHAHLHRILSWCHTSNGHPASDRTVHFFLKSFFTPLTRQQLLDMSNSLFGSCPTCLLSKPNTAPDRGLLSALPIPQIANDILFIDFIDMPQFNHFNYILTIVDSLTRFTHFIPCTKNITGEGTLRLLLTEWIRHYDKPQEIMSDNDVRFSQEKGFYQSVFKAMGIAIHFSLPRRPQSNGLCEKINGLYLQNLRAMLRDCNSTDWPKVTPYVNWLMNSQISTRTGFSPSELFLGKPSWKFELVPEITSNPTVQSFLSDQMLMQEQAAKRLSHLRHLATQRANRGRTLTAYYPHDYVLVHKSRWPQRKLSKIQSPWLGPFQVLQVRHNALRVAVSPTLGGVIEVALSMVKRWTSLHHDDPGLFDPDPDDLDRDIDLDPNDQANRNDPDTQLTSEEKGEQGFYNVEAILRHKFHQGWRFLTHWQGFPVSASTWEPVRSFTLPQGRTNSIFVEYLKANGLHGILAKVLKQ
jgi:transposase InsO family protein